MEIFFYKNLKMLKSFFINVKIEMLKIKRKFIIIEKFIYKYFSLKNI